MLDEPRSLFERKRTHIKLLGEATFHWLVACRHRFSLTAILHFLCGSKPQGVF
jgi:hypothetical protein